jgi:hypothetical protein
MQVSNYTHKYFLDHELGLSGRPLSDASFLVREAARIAAKSGKSKIDNASIEQALKLVVRKKKTSEKRKIGFGKDV